MSCGWEDALDDLYAMVANGSTDYAVDLVMNHVDDAFLAGDFESVDGMLRDTDTNRLDTYTCVALLSATKAAAHHLPSRPALVERVSRRLRVLAPGREHLLIVGII